LFLWFVDTRAHGVEQRAVGAGFGFCVDLVALGDDTHSFHVHAHRWTEPDGVTHDVQTVSPASSFEIRWKEDTPGTWLYHCHVEAHMAQGMIGLYRVRR